MRLIALVTALLLIAVAPAYAEPPPDAAAAEQHFQAGLELARLNRWEEALVEFRKAHAIYPQHATLLNVASAEVQTGRLVEGAQSYRALLRQVDLSDGMRGVARDALARAEARLGHLRIVVERRQTQDRVNVDGRQLSEAELDTDLSMDPGEHLVVLHRRGVEGARSVVALREGEVRSLTLRTSRALEVPEPKRSLFASPWFWTVAGAVLVGAAVTVVCIAECRKEGPAETTNSVTLK